MKYTDALMSVKIKRVRDHIRDATKMMDKD